MESTRYVPVFDKTALKKRGAVVLSDLFKQLIVQFVMNEWRYSGYASACEK